MNLEFFEALLCMPLQCKTILAHILGSGFWCYVKLCGLEDWKLVCYYLGNEKFGGQMKYRC